MIALTLEWPVTAGNFDEQGYLEANPDVAAAVRAGSVQSGRAHFEQHGLQERRRVRLPLARFLPLKRSKLEKIAPFLRADLPCQKSDGRVDYLGERPHENSPASSHNYDPFARELIARYADGWILDCGAGKRTVYYSNVVNFEIAPYDTTDVLGVGEDLPFRDESFDAVFSLSVLEHVRDPFRCAQEIVRVLKPGGEMLCAVPFLQPLHGYPGHYFNMTHQGLRALFEGSLQVEWHTVPPSGLPVWTLSWMLGSWAAALAPETRRQFLETKVSDWIGDPVNLLNQRFVTELSAEKNLELASMTLLRARKPSI